MTVKRIVAADMRSALQAISEQFGPDAAVMSNKRVPEGIELLFSVPEDAEGKAIEPVLDPVSAAADTDRSTLEKGMILQKQEIRQKAKLIEQKLQRKKQKMSAADVYELRALDEKPEPAAKRQAAPAAQQNRFAEAVAKTTGEAPNQTAQAGSQLELESLRHELAQMRSVFQSQLESMRWPQFQQQQPQKADYWRRLTAMGLQPELIRSCLDTLSRGNANLSWPQVLDFLQQRLACDVSDPIMAGGVHVFVGPTGVGKTTTIGKLATQYVLKHGVDDIALVTTDTFRIAGSEQLRVISRLLNIPLVVSKPEHLARDLESLKQKKLVLVDTAGVNASDAAQMAQLVQVANLNARLQTWLLMSATSQYKVLAKHNDLYRQAKPAAIILTKTDESVSLGESLSWLLQQALPLAYTTFGQQIPADMACVDSQQLIAQCAENAQESVSSELLSMGFSQADRSVEADFMANSQLA